VRIGINLATQPFRRHRAVLVGSAAVGVLLIALFVMLVSLAVLDHKSSAVTRRQIATLDKQLRGIATDQSRLDSILRRPENAEVLERSVFLNSLLYRKGISWTKIFADLEKTVPYNVRVISIRPQVNAQNQVFLDMNVGAESTEPVLKFLIELENSKVFGGAAVPTRLPPSQTEPLFRYRVSVNYAQKL
jgi:Tfp pilus assembly protein PilN